MKPREPRYDGPWPVDAFRVWPLRHEVLRSDQPYEASRYDGDDDPLALHVAVFDGHEVVAAASLFPENGWRIRGMATLPEHRGRGLGGRVLASLLEGASARGGGRVWCNARLSAAGFYTRSGFEPEGEVFDLNPIGPHRVLVTEVQPTDAGPEVEAGEARILLERTPGLLDGWLRGLPPAFLTTPEGPGLWTARDVVGHLVHGEQDDWIVRAEHIVGPDRERSFRPFDRMAMVRRFHALSLDELLDAFARARRDALERLDRIDLTEEVLALEGRHPDFGAVSLRQLLSAWVCHDLSHLAQVGRILARRFVPEVGPWARYIRLAREES